MSTWTFVKSKPIALNQHSELPESWIQDQIAQDPAILGLGELKVCYRQQLPGGLHELVLERSANGPRCAVLVQTGPTDEAQLVRAIESWSRQPNRLSSAVLVSEQIGSRFLNLIPVLASSVPLAAIQMQAIELGEQMTVIFTTLAGQPLPVELGDETSNGAASAKAALELFEQPAAESTVPFDAPSPLTLSAQPEAQGRPAEDAIRDRSYWEDHAQPSVEIADQLLSVARIIDPALELDYRASYIGLVRHGAPVSFARFLPEPDGIVLGLNIEPSSLIELSIAQAGLNRLPNEEGKGYSIRIDRRDLDAQRAPVARLIQLAYEESRQ